MPTELTVEINGIQFEEDYIYRSNRAITTTPDIALTEFVANAWDAGAYHVYITIPAEGIDSRLVIEDDGTGMSDEEFRQRWMTLNYNRQKRQGKEVVFPDANTINKRIAYGRNGIGRHGMLCFNTMYRVETWKNGILNTYDITVSSGNEPFKIALHSVDEKEGHGTRLSTYIHKNHPNPNAMTEIISARFLYDPKFIVQINGNAIDLLEQKNIYCTKDVQIHSINLHITVIDSTKTALKSQQHGIAFWISGRLVGKPSWNIGDYQFLDGRFKAAKRYTIIVQTNDLIDEILPDWTGFIDSEIMKPDQILIIELKRGGFEITPDEVSQAENYVRQIRKSAVLHSSATIRAFVVGASIGDVDNKKETSSGRIDVVTYGQLIQTAKVKLFRLQEQLTEHYNAMDDASIVERALKQTKQIKLNLTSRAALNSESEIHKSQYIYKEVSNNVTNTQK